MHKVTLLNLLLALTLLVSGSLTFPRPVPPVAQTPGVQVDPELVKQIQADETTGYMIYLRDRADLSPALEMNWKERGQFVMESLQRAADKAQSRVRAYLDGQGAAYKSFWIDNVIVVSRSNNATLTGLMNFAEIESLRAQPQVSIHEPATERSPSAGPLVVEANIAHVNADDVWGLGYNGAGIVVANIDTGVRYTHQALVGHYRGNLGGGTFNHNYNWWDPYGTYSSPTDANSHGSHTMGTMVGDDGGTNQIGMAPGARWMACRGCSTSSCGSAQLLECAQFVAAPWNLSHTSPDPNQRPHVVNNSWGDCGTSYNNWFQGAVNSWHAAGIYPVFSNGNASNCGYSSPPGLNTVGNPARYGNVTGVGSTGNSNGLYAPHSNWGPTDNPDTLNALLYPSLKPQVVAPGVSIRSSTNSSDTAYSLKTGTSMSAPHVAGLVALMWDAAPCLIGNYAATETIIEQTATPIPYATGGTPPPGPGNVPNYATGWGEINALAAVQLAVNRCVMQNVMIEDTQYDGGPVDIGSEPNVEMAGLPMWKSKSIWVRYQPDGIYGHQNPEYGQPNYVYARLWNGSSAPMTGDVQFWWANASTGLSWPTQWNFIGAVPLTIAGHANQDAHITWATVPHPGHFCLVALWVSASDPLAFPLTPDINADVYNNNNMAWRNVNVIDLLPNARQRVDFIIRNLQAKAMPINLIVRPAPNQARFLEQGQITLELEASLFDRWLSAGARGWGFKLVEGTTQVLIYDPKEAVLQDLPLEIKEESTVGATFEASPEAQLGLYPVEMVQSALVEGKTVEQGGVAYVINVTDKISPPEGAKASSPSPSKARISRLGR